MTRRSSSSIRPRPVLALLALFLTVSATAQPAPTPNDAISVDATQRQWVRRSPADVVLRVPLAPAPSVQGIHPEMALEYLADGRRRLVSSGLMESEGELSFFFVADPALGTYDLVELTASPDLNRARLGELLKPYDEVQESWDAILDLLSTELLPEPRTDQLKASPDRAVTGKSIITCDECSGSWTGYVATLDPVYIELTRTTNRSTWRAVSKFARSPGGTDQLSTSPLSAVTAPIQTNCDWIESGTGTCAAAYPSPLGTHWFIDACFQTGPYGYVYQHDHTVYGSYHNDDFLLDSLRTYVDQSVNIRLYPGFGTSWSYSHVDSGEGSSLIFGSFSISGGNTCF